MRHVGLFVPLPLLFAAVMACGSVPSEDLPSKGGRAIAPAGVIRGTVVYSGPHPCSQNGHIVGAALVLVFDRNNPPPPNGTASTAINFGVVTGDVLFSTEPRNPGADLYCPLDRGVTDTITASGPFEISPLTAASYILASFYDYTGDFLPGFKFRNLPEMGDIAGGDIDTADALKSINAGNPNYQAHFLPVDVGIAQPFPADASLPPSPVPNFVLPDQGFVADNVTVTVGEVLPMARPYFYPQGLSVQFDPVNDPNDISTSPVQSSDQPAMDRSGIDTSPEANASNPTIAKNYAPILAFPQDIQVYAAPNALTPQNVNNFESKFPHLRLQWGVPAAEASVATDPKQPFHFQLAPGGGFSLWQNATFDSVKQQWVPQEIPEHNVPYIWPLIVLSKLVDDPSHTADPASLTAQGDANSPVVVLQAITLLGDNDLTMGESLTLTGAAELPGATAPLFNTKTGRPRIFTQDHITVLLRPAVLCFDSLFDPNAFDKRAVLVTPYLMSTSADLPTGVDGQLVVPMDLPQNPAVSALVRDIKIGCLPTGRYAVNVVYPDQQAWTVPNETGSCSGTEGSTVFDKLTCSVKPRPILYSQGNRAVVEITPAQDPTHCTKDSPVPPVPDACLKH